MTKVQANAAPPAPAPAKAPPWPKTALVTAAWAAVRVKGSYPQGQVLHLKARRGARKAILAPESSCFHARRWQRNAAASDSNRRAFTSATGIPAIVRYNVVPLRAHSGRNA